MSYIRTKDAIYTLSEAYWAGIEDETIADADTIEELCDEFVKIWNDTGLLPELLDFDEEYEYEQEMMKTTYPKGNISIYGAIWTSKGLIYVAKMNEKGELELL